jgi:hypothetical protein
MDPPRLVRVAIMKGGWRNPETIPLMVFEMDSHVHAEVWIDNMGFSAFDGEYRPNSQCVLKVPRPAPGEPVDKEWDVFPLRLSDEARAVEIMTETWNSPARYSLNVRDFILPQRLVNYADPDVDCTKPLQWTTLFCSQFVLLFMRRCAEEGILSDPNGALWRMNSRSCTPSHLTGIMRRLLLPPLPPPQAKPATPAPRRGSTTRPPPRAPPASR